MSNQRGKNNQTILKVICLGNVSTGKTSIIKRYVTNEYSDQYRTTIGVDFMLKQVKVDNNDVRVQFWDLAGQERFAGLSRAYYRHAGGAIIVFDITARDTFNAVINWKKDIDQKIELQNGKKIPVLLLGNKSDLIVDNPQAAAVTDEEIQAVVKEYDFYAYASCSALSGNNIVEPVESHVKEIIHRMALENDGSGGTTADFYHTQKTENKPTVDLNNNKNEQANEGGCC